MVAKIFHLNENLVEKIKEYAKEKRIDQVVVVRAALLEFFKAREAEKKFWASQELD